MATKSTKKSNPGLIEANPGLIECHCLAKLSGRLTSMYGDSVALQTETVFNFKTGASRAIVPPLEYTYVVGKKKKRGYVFAAYCQFCGRKEP